MEIVSIIGDIIIVLCCAFLIYLSSKVCKENVELRKDLRIVLHYIPVANSAEYFHLVKKYSVKELTFKESNDNENMYSN